jgi:hypothetical protein
MTALSRVISILEAKTLDSEITGMPTFDLAQLRLRAIPDIQLPTNLRLGHLAERIISELIKASSNYKMLYENLQIREDDRTIGELDFLIQDVHTKNILHVELAYKFYLYDPDISGPSINNWIGPNRRDTLSEKLTKLKIRQFPLLNRASTGEILGADTLPRTEQSLCFIANLFTPYASPTALDPRFQAHVKGYYLDAETFMGWDHADGQYYIPNKTEWGIDPSLNSEWKNYGEIKEDVRRIREEQQSRLCWMKQDESYTQFFITWW